MDRRSPTSEANLLYKTAPQPDLAAAEEDIRDILEEHGAMLLGTERIDGIYTLLMCDIADVLIGLTPDPLSVGHFLGTERPVAASLSEHEILTRLSAHSACAIVIVAEPEIDPPAADESDDVLRAICEELADWLCRTTDPDLVFWCETDTLYTSGEFTRDRAFRTAQAEASAPILSQTALAWIDGQNPGAADADGAGTGLAIDALCAVTLATPPPDRPPAAGPARSAGAAPGLLAAGIAALAALASWPRLTGFFS